MPHRTIILLSAALTLPVAALLVYTPQAGCHLQVIPDYVTPIGYRARLQASPDCHYGSLLRVRKSSTLNVKRNGAPYQPIRPTQGAWEVGQGLLPELKNRVPETEIPTSTLTGWRWEYWSPQTWNTRTNQYGRWLAAEVLRAAP